MPLDYDTSGLGAGAVDYVAAWERQREVHAEVAAGTRPDTVLLLEHPPVCFAGGPTPIDGTVSSGAVQLPRSLDAAVAVVADVIASGRGTRPR